MCCDLIMTMKDKPIVSVVIVCMNNLKNLIPCLDSILKYTSVDYEIWVNAYMFSPENLQIVKLKYPSVKWIVNNNIAGFSENNNMILRQLKTKYALVLNDDTLFKEPVLDKLIASIERTENANTMSPMLLNGDGSYQSCGRPPIRWYDFLIEDTFGRNNDKHKSKYTNQKGIFKSYNVTGACFLIRIDYFKTLGFFDEYYFFTPEDIALSTKINELGGNCYVDSNIRLYHLSGGTRKSKVKMATLPSQRKGCIHFHGRNSHSLKIFMELTVFTVAFFKSIVFFCMGKTIEGFAQWHCVCTIFSSMTPKEIFIKYYSKM